MVVYPRFQLTSRHEAMSLKRPDLHDIVPFRDCASET
jgi:hypothetical protein